MSRIILASNSPRRKELLSGLGLEFTVDIRNNFEEFADPSWEAHRVPLEMSKGKSAGFHRALENDEVLITSDTVVIIDGCVLGKPHSREEAVSMLQRLSGRCHEVVTAVTIRNSERQKDFSVSSFVYFADIPLSDIERYVDDCKPFDKAGAYGIQEWIGYSSIARVEGSFYNVMGLPTHRVWQELKEFI